MTTITITTSSPAWPRLSKYLRDARIMDAMPIAAMDMLASQPGCQIARIYAMKPPDPEAMDSHLWTRLPFPNDSLFILKGNYVTFEPFTPQGLHMAATGKPGRAFLACVDEEAVTITIQEEEQQ